MTIGGQDLLTILVVSLISFLSGTVKTILAYCYDAVFPKKIDFIVNVILSFFVGILASFICSYFKLDEELMYIIVALSALSAERLLSKLPTIFVKKIENVVGVEPTQKEYDSDPIGNLKQRDK